MHGGWHYIPDSSMSDRGELFNVEADPFEEKNLVGDEQYGHILKFLKESIDEWNARYPLPKSGPAEIDEKTRKKLKGLGYIH